MVATADASESLSSAEAVSNLQAALATALAAPLDSVSVFDVATLLPPSPPMSGQPPVAPIFGAAAGIAASGSGMAAAGDAAQPLLWLLLLLIPLVPALAVLATVLYARVRFPGRVSEYLRWRLSHSNPTVAILYMAPEYREQLGREFGASSRAGVRSSASRAATLEEGVVEGRPADAVLTEVSGSVVWAEVSGSHSAPTLPEGSPAALPTGAEGPKRLKAARVHKDIQACRI